MARTGAALDDVVSKYDWQMSSLSETDCVSWSPTQFGSSILVLFLNTESEFECAQLSSQAGSVRRPDVALHDGRPVKLRRWKG